MKQYNVLSLFGGIECGRLAMERAGIPVANYASSEVDKHAVNVSGNMWPGIQHLGDVRGVRVKDLGFIPDIIFAGFPCQGFSFAGKGLNFEDPRSQLFFEFVRILEECREINPGVLFLGENVPMKKASQMVISERLGVNPTRQRGALVSAQNRDRLFWTNIKTKKVGLFGEVYSDIPQPADKGIFLRDILENEVSEKYFISSSRHESMLKRIGKYTQLDGEKSMCFTTRTDAGWQGEMITLKTDTNGSNSFEQNNHVLKGATVRRLTPVEVCRLFTLSDDYFYKRGKQVVSDSQIYRLCGNGWIVDQVAHILTFIKK